MSTDAWIVVGIVLGALVLFASERVRPDVVGLLALVALGVSRVVEPAEAFAGFANPAVITVAAMFVLSAGTVEAGVPEAIAGLLARHGGTRLVPLIVMLILVVGAMSAFMNNIAATVILIPAAITLAHGAQTEPSKLLMPLSFGSLLGGLITLVGTPPNLLVSEALAAAGERPFGMFDFAPTGAAVLGVGLLYMAIAGPRLLPARQRPGVDRRVEQTRAYLAELVIPNDSGAIGRTLRHLRWQSRYDVAVIEIVRDGHRNRFPSAAEAIFIADVLLVEGERDDVMRLVGAEDVEFAAERETVDSLIEDSEASVFELVAGPSFAGRGRTVAQMGFRSRFGGLVLAIWRQGRPVRAAIRKVPIEPGDVLLVRMPPGRVRQLSGSPDFIVLEQRPRVLRPRPRMLVAVAILALVVSLAATGAAHIAVAGAVGVVLMLAARVVPYDRLYAAIDWRTLVLIGSLIPLGTAIERSGLAGTAAESVTGWLEAIGPIGVLAGIFILTAVVTQIMSNAAAVVLVAPIALGIAAQLAIAPHPVMMMVAISGSTAFLTPIGHQANVLVYNAGGYRFVDFVRVGGPLTLLILMVSLVVVPIVWPL